MSVLFLIAAGFLQTPRPMNVEDVLALASITSPEISPDGARVAYVVTRPDLEANQNDSDVWVVGTHGDAPIRLTFAKGVDEAPQWAPDGGYLLFASEREGDRQVFAIRPDGGEAWPMTNWGGAVESFAISPDGTKLAFVGKLKIDAEQERFEKERGRPDVWGEYYDDEWSHLWVAPLVDGRAGDAERWSAEGHFVTSLVWSPDARRLAYGARPAPALRTNREANVYLVAGPDGVAQPITDMPGGETPVAWTQPRGVIVAGTGQLLGTYNAKLWTVSPLTCLTETLDEHARYVTSSAEELLVEASRGTGRGLLRITKGEVTPLSAGTHYYGSFSANKDGSRVAFLAESGREDADVYVASPSEWKPTRLTHANPQLAELALGEQRVVRWESRADGETIEGILTLPVGYREGGRVPLLLVIHGGPSGVSSDRFSGRRGAYPIQVFAGLGYAVLQPNYRGSTGYGERFRGLNRGDISGRDWVDVDSGVDAMIAQGIADPERLGIMGWSFGGHHTYWGITQTDRFKAASAGAGANDLVSMYSQTDLPEFYHTYLGPKPWEDFELYEERSAYRNVARVSTPLLIQVGERDDRVPAEQSIQFYEAVKAIGKVETKLVVYPGQPHGVRAPRLVRDLMIRNVEWFRRFIPTELPSAGTAVDPK